MLLTIRQRLDMFLVLIFLGMVGSANSAIPWAAAASAITSGASLISSLAGAPGYKVVCTVEIENWTKYTLKYPASHINGGTIKSPPVVVLPGKREAFVAHNTASGVYGTWGTASWLISSSNRRAVVMWSCPINFNRYSNWLAVGLTTPGVQSHRDWFDQMYYKSNGNELNFIRGEYYHNTETISIKDDKFEVTGIMGTSHKAKARIIVKPRHLNDLASSLKTKLENALI